MILITSLKKQRFRNDQPTSELYSIQSWINPEKIVSIVPTKTSIQDFVNNIDYMATGSKVTMTNNSRLTSDLSPSELIDLINSCYEHDVWVKKSIGGTTPTE